MSAYGVTGVHLDEQGNLVRACMQQVDPAANAWIGEPQEVAAHQLANLIAIGDDVFSIFIVPGGTVHGPRFQPIVYPGGAEGAALSEDVEGRRLQDLVLF